MEFQTLKKDHKKKYIIGLVVISAIVVTLTYISTRAKYRVTNSIQLASGVINYSPSDLEIVAIKIQNDSGEYDNTDTIPTSGYKLNSEKSICKIGETKQDVTITYENGKINLDNLTTKGTKCELYFDVKLCPNGATTCELIMANNILDTSRSNGEFSNIFEENTQGRIFSAEDNDGTTYFFAGSSPNNWVSFAGFYWRIIRINGDGSIRLIYNGTSTSTTGTTTQIGKSAFNTRYNDNAYVGYMYGTVGSGSYATTHANTNSSVIKNYLDDWYNTNLKVNYEQYIDSNAGFCGDRTIDKTSGYHYPGDGYGANASSFVPFGRLYDNGYKTIQNSTYKCNNKNDLYTASTSTKGNKSLTNLIGLISSDEVIYAGGKAIVGNSNYWLYTNQIYWTMSPSSFDGTYIYILAVSSYGYIDNDSAADNYGGVRPVINLKANTLKIGSGTTSDPFKIA